MKSSPAESRSPEEQDRRTDPFRAAFLFLTGRNGLRIPYIPTQEKGQDRALAIQG